MDEKHEKGLFNLGLRMQDVSGYTSTLTQYVITNMTSLIHANGSPVIVLYHCTQQLQNIEKQGPIVNFNILKTDGSYVGFSEV